MPSLMMMTSTVSEESLVRDTHTHAHTYSLVYVIHFFKVLRDFENKNASKRIGFWSINVHDFIYHKDSTSRLTLSLIILYMMHSYFF